MFMFIMMKTGLSNGFITRPIFYRLPAEIFEMIFHTTGRADCACVFNTLLFSRPPMGVEGGGGDTLGGGEESLRRLVPQVNSPPNNCEWTGASGTLYVYDGWRVIQERDLNNVPTVSYTRGNDLSGSLERAGGIGGLLARSAGYSGGNW